MSDLKPVIKVIGVGGGGCNAISFMSFSEIAGVEFLAANTDAQDLEKIKNVQNKIQLGEKLTSGLGAGADPKIGRKSAEEDEEIIQNYLKGSNLLFISAGMGGGTGTGAAPVIADIARKMGMLVIAVVTKPFSFERESRMNKALKGIQELRDSVDSLIIIPNDKLKEVLPPNTPLTSVFESVDQVLHDAIQGISDIITKPGLINIDFNDLKTIMKDSGNSMIGIGKSSGDNRARKAAEEAISCPFLEEKNLSSAKRVIVNVTLAVDGSLEDFDEVGEVIKSITAEGAEVIMGTSIDDKATDQVTVTIVATDFLSNLDREAELLKIQEDKEKEIQNLKNKVKEEEEASKYKLPSFLNKNKSKNKITEEDLRLKKQDNVEEKTIQTIDEAFNQKEDLSLDIKEEEKDLTIEKEDNKINDIVIPDFLKKSF